MNDFAVAFFTLLVFSASFCWFLILGLLRSQKQGADEIRRRLDALSMPVESKSELNLLRDRFRNNLPWFDRVLIQLPGVERHVDYANYSTSILRLRHQAIWSGVLFAAAFITLINVSGEAYFALGVSGLVGALPLLRLNWLSEKRLAAFEVQLPEALEAMTRALRAGYPLMESIRMISEEMPEPLGAEFKTLFEEINAGVDMRTAFLALRSRVPSVSLMVFTTSVLLQRETGGNLTEALSKISLIIRKRFTFERNVRTLTAEGRVSAWVLGLLPVGLYLMFYIMNPDYASLLITDPQGRKLTMFGLVFLGCGSLWLRRIIRAAI